MNKNCKAIDCFCAPTADIEIDIVDCYLPVQKREREREREREGGREG